MHRHRSGTLKQKNKSHRGSQGHSSKRALKRAQGGKVNAKADGNGSQHSASAGSKYQRLLRAKQQRKQQRAQQWVERRTGTKQGAPLTVLVLSLSPSGNPHQLMTELLALADKTSANSLDCPAAVTVGVYPKLRTRLQFIAQTYDCSDDPLTVLEYARSADVIVPVLSGSQGPDSLVDENGLRIAALLRSQGMPAVVGALRDMEGLGTKQTADLKRRAARFLNDEFGQHAKLISENGSKSKPSETLLRAISTITQRPLAWREIRPYMLAQQIEALTPNGEDCGLCVSGYLRGAPLHVHQLIHVPEIGPRRILRITSASDPCPMKEGREHPSMETVLAENLEGEGDPLKLEAETDGLNGEQTWPTEYEMSQARADADQFKSQLPPGTSDYQAAWLGPEDLLDDEEEEDEAGEDGMLDLGSEAGAAVMRSLQQGAKKDTFAFLESTKKKPESVMSYGMNDEDDDDSYSAMDDVQLSPEELERERRLKKLERAVEDAAFPDEVDTPFDRPARERFARYRNLKSFRTSPWDPKESLPRDYSRLFDFGDFRVTQKRVLWDSHKAKNSERRLVVQNSAPSSIASASGLGSSKSSRASFASTIESTEMEDEGSIADRPQAMGPPMTLASLESSVQSGEMGEEEEDFDPRGWITTGYFVRIQLAGVSPEEARKVIECAQSCPQTLFALHKHENRLSLLNFSVQRTPELFLDEDEVVQSKDPMWAVCGFRRWLCRPVISEQNLNADKHKFMRYLPSSTFVVMSCYGPATYSPAPVLMFRAKSVGAAEVLPRGGNLVATGTLGSVDVDRIVLKKVVLTGYPVRVHKRTAVIKHMFYYPEDIAWFKPIELTTKMGLSGHIKCPVGTHGLFKVHFGRVLKGNDTVCLNLFKRVYPKFVEEARDDMGESEGEALTQSELVVLQSRRPTGT